MSKADFQNSVRKNEGYILSDGTLNLEHLLPKAYDFLDYYKIRNVKLKKDILECFEIDGEFLGGLFTKQYYGEARLKDDSESMEKANYLWNEEIYNFFNEISPNGYIFGSSEHDWALIGWFKYESEEV